MSETSSEFERLLSYLKNSRGFDFTAYKRSTLQRRIQKRMSAVGSANYADYIDYLEVHPEEFRSLFNTILINVTSFFRDVEAWDYVRDTVIPQIIGRKGADEPVRVWVAGCASGEEAYSVAMLLAEALGPVTFRERVKIYATDLDDEALTQSRVAAYTPKDVQAVPADLVEKYFESIYERPTFDRDLRRSIIFGQHDLLQDAPISRVDLLLCRNTLMYFNAEAQDRILARFHFALNDGGYLFLGMAETLLTHASIFVPVDLKHRVFNKVPRTRARDRGFLFAAPLPETQKPQHQIEHQLLESATDTVPVANFILDVSGVLVRVNERARHMFGLTAIDVGRMIQDLEVSYRPVELRSGIEQAHAQRRPVVYKDTVWTAPSGESLVLDVRIMPIIAEGGAIIGTSVSALDVTQFRKLQDELQNFNQELETAYEEVQSTNEELQTTNEELQSTVEELETTNEELQSTNEELETMNEELQSTNEELETINEELRRRSTELNQANLFLHSILVSLREGVIVVDADLHVLAWNARSEDLWGLRSEEVKGKHLMNLDIGMPLEQLMVPVRTCLHSGASQEVTIEAVNRRGRTVLCRVSCAPLHGIEESPKGVIIMLDDSSTD
jgi:two-component system, chemotaxis family, CheB/CheR fusion protein